VAQPGAAVPQTTWLVALIALFFCACAFGADDDPAAQRFREVRKLCTTNPAQAVEQLRKFLADFPESTLADAAQFWLASSLEKTRADRDDIIAAYRALIDRYPKSEYCDDALFAVAEIQRRTARSAEEIARAIETYQEFVKTYPDSERLGEVELKLGEIYRQQKKYDEAATWFRKVVDDHPTSAFAVPASMQLASTFFTTKKVDEALEIYHKLLEAPTSDEQRIRIRLGIVDCWLSRPDGLEKAVEECHTIRDEANQKRSLQDFADYSTRDKLATYYLGRNKYAEAEDEYQAYVSRFGTSVGVWQAKLNIGSIRMADGKFAEAREMFTDIISKHPADTRDLPWYVIRARYNEACTYELEKNLPEAKRLYRKLIEQFPRSADARRAKDRLEGIEKTEKPAK
jgi:TolA-binding protein